MRPIAVIAIAVLAAFFMPWITITAKVKGFESSGSMTGMDMAMHADQFDAYIGGKGAASMWGVNVSVWFWALPALALLTILTTGKGILGRLLGLLTGAYPFAWLTFWYLKIPDKERTKFLHDVGDHIFDFLGVGMYVVLIGSLLLVIFGLAGVGASPNESE